ncbi:Crp/Fnr family transcriptional regulator [Phenylobacterium deserti]|uniref:Crp/Fnr family transcriptional regulator n=1 Tax=Phenylobacterium deserti TaxID=1914756 RepID=A0A328AU64_9CAUL|nr:Crp/Fnr family transcriptional regulator [Phenylobacterium deserti]RAK58129.1 Crp/Fnr family transcriptional regulator [Phenylobacterium deserti]
MSLDLSEYRSFAPKRPNSGVAAMPFARRLNRFGLIAPTVLSALRQAAERPDWREVGEPLVAGVSGGARVILSGWAGEELQLPDGGRQICRILIPGDVVGLPRSRARAACAITALTPVSLADGSEVFGAGYEQDPTLRAAAAAFQEEAEAALLNHLLRLGRLNALQRTAHLFLELHERLAAAGLTQGARCPMPLTQEVLADVLGLSVVHVNRTLQTLKRERLVSTRRGSLEMLRLDALGELACLRIGRDGASAPRTFGQEAHEVGSQLIA